MTRIAWRWEDPTAGTVEYMEVNPNSGASPAYKKTLTKVTTSAPDGQVLLYEGQDEPRTFDCSGVILFESQWDFLYNAWNKRHPVLLTDDLGRTWTIYIESFNPKREPRRSHPWRHTYDFSAVIIS
jgi:hypothetical protein